MEQILVGKLPHPIPYQGSKRSLARLIGEHVPTGIQTWFEPFAGSAAMTLWAASNDIADRYVISDVLFPISELWLAIIDHPHTTASQYRKIWEGQSLSGPEYYNHVRDRYNKNGRNPIDLLYLICRCVKNAVRFSINGRMTQSVDKRRLGMRPEKMEKAIFGASELLKGRVEVRSGDWLTAIRDAGPRDFIYMDPPYLGTTIGPDKRYAEQLQSDRLIFGLRNLLDRDIRFAVSYDGMTGTKVYGPALPKELGLNRLLLPAGRSSQATLSGRFEETIESLYLSPGIGEPRRSVIRRQREIQTLLAI